VLGVGEKASPEHFYLHSCRLEFGLEGAVHHFVFSVTSYNPG
jgi:hypothetical protein